MAPESTPILEGTPVSQFLNVQPAAEQRRAFAVWASAQVPKVRTVSQSAFAVPHDLYTAVPEPVLVGALVDGHRYVSPDEDAGTGQAAPAAPELLGVATAVGFAPPAPGSPEVDAAAMIAATSPALIESAMAAGSIAAVIAAGNAASGLLVPGDDGTTPSGSVLPADEPSDSSDPGGGRPEGAFPCSGCAREFTTARGLGMHRCKASDTETKD